MRKLLLILITVFSTIALASCNHKHDMKYSYDADQHWTMCECGEKTTSKLHEFVWETIEEATCSTPAKEKGTCICGYERIRDGQAGKHNYVDNADDTSHWSECSGCHKTKNKEEHTLVKLEVVEPATLTTKEKAKFSCSICKHEIVKELDFLTVDYLADVIFEGITVSYTAGLKHKVEATNIPSNVTVEYQGNGVTEVGEHTVTANFYDLNHDLITSMTAVISVIEYDVVLPPIE